MKTQCHTASSFQAWFIENTPNVSSTNQYYYYFFSIMFNKRNICLQVLVKLTWYILSLWHHFCSLRKHRHVILLQQIQSSSPVTLPPFCFLQKFIIQRKTRQKTHQQSKLHWGSEEGEVGCWGCTCWMSGQVQKSGWGGREKRKAGGQDVEVTAHWTGRESYKTHLF